MIFNFHTYKEEIKGSILRWLGNIDVFEHQSDYAWLVYALSCDGVDNNPLFDKYFDSLRKWSLNDEIWKPDRNLSVLSIVSYLTQKKGSSEWQELSDRIISRLKTLIDKEFTKYSIFNTPEQLFAIILGNKQNFGEDLTEKLKKMAIKSSESGGIKRRTLFIAALLEFGVNRASIRVPTYKDINLPEDSIALLWLAEKYNLNEKNELWQTFTKIKEALATPIMAEEISSLIYLSSFDIAMLYEALEHETRSPDPDMLFDVYPLHPRIREISEDLFKKKEYVSAVFEAAKALEDYIKNKTGKQKYGRELVGETMNPENPIIKFNPLTTRTHKNEQEGLKLVTEGVFAAFRNPKGHEPKDKQEVQITPYGALTQLIVISYLMERIDKASIQRQKQ